MRRRNQNPYAPEISGLEVLPISMPGPDISVLEQADLRTEADRRRIGESLDVLHRGPFETMYVTDQRIPLPGALGWNLVPFTVLTFLVPASHTFALTHLALMYSESVLAQSLAVGWRLCINGTRVPNVFPAVLAVGGTEWSAGGIGDLTRPSPLPDVWVQSGQSVQLQVMDLTGTLFEYVIISALLAGRLYPNVGGAV